MQINRVVWMCFIFVHLNSQDCEENNKWQRFVKLPPVFHTNKALPVSDIITSSVPTQATKVFFRCYVAINRIVICSSCKRIVNIELQLRYSSPGRTVSKTLEFQWLLKETGTSPQAPQLNQPAEWKENQTFSTSPDSFLSPANTAGKQRISVFLHTCPLHRREVVKMASLTSRKIETEVEKSLRDFTRRPPSDWRPGPRRHLTRTSGVTTISLAHASAYNPMKRFSYVTRDAG